MPPETVYYSVEIPDLHIWLSWILGVIWVNSLLYLIASATVNTLWIRREKDMDMIPFQWNRIAISSVIMLVASIFLFVSPSVNHASDYIAQDEKAVSITSGGIRYEVGEIAVNGPSLACTTTDSDPKYMSILAGTRSINTHLECLPLADVLPTPRPVNQG